MKESNAQRRVAVAKDVLKQIRLKKLKPKTGFYLDASFSKTLKGGEDLQGLIKGGKLRKCEACALGSALMSYARLYDGISIGEFGAFGEVKIAGRAGVALPRTIVSRRPEDSLGALFGADQMEDIERAFESELAQLSARETTEEAEFGFNAWSKAERFGAKYRKPADRLVAIMKNIVKNKGTFKP